MSTMGSLERAGGKIFLIPQNNMDTFTKYSLGIKNNPIQAEYNKARVQDMFERIKTAVSGFFSAFRLESSNFSGNFFTNGII
ncbi:MAG: hypothetical protein WDZ28_00915 [Simkaniaceae bacterium]